MNDEAAEPRGQSGPSQDVPAPSAAAGTTPPAASPTDEPISPAAAPTEPISPVTAPTEPIPPAAAPTDELTEPIKPAAWTPPPSGPEADVPPFAAGPPPPPPPPGFTPPWASGATFSRDKLVRPRQGRYVAGVCGALARATNTDPVLWRVLLAVLGVLSGVGILLYLIGWLTIPVEGEPVSPIESVLGKGRSGMAPLSVIVLGAATVLTFAFVMQNGMRAALLAAAVVLGGILLIKRRGTGTPAPFPATFGPSPAGPPPQPAPDYATAQFGTTQFGTTQSATTQFGTPPAPGAPATDPLTEPFAATAPPYAPPSAPYTPPSAPYTAPAGGYRPPFAPHGPFARGPQPPPAPIAPAQRPPRPKRERSKLGRLTFFAVLVVVGVMSLADMAGASIAISAYFAAALVTIALGLIVGAWLGRARGLIALALLTTLGLVASTGAESFGGDVGKSVYRPDSVRAVADRYDFAAGNATLDLRGVDFTGQVQQTTVTMKLGQLRVLLPPTVDTTATLQLSNGSATVLGKEYEGRAISGQTVTDLGTDGTGGGTLKLTLQMDTGNVEVNR